MIQKNVFVFNLNFVHLFQLWFAWFCFYYKATYLILFLSPLQKHEKFNPKSHYLNRVWKAFLFLINYILNQKVCWVGTLWFSNLLNNGLIFDNIFRIFVMKLDNKNPKYVVKHYRCWSFCSISQKASDFVLTIKTLP